MTSKIEWTTDTWNIITGCTQCSEGCKNCYAKRMHKRLTAMGQEKYKEPFENIVFHDEELSNAPKGKNKLVFVNSMSDTFHEEIQDCEINAILDACEFKPIHQYQILTKRAYRLPDFRYPENVWLGVTVENANHKDRIEYLRKTDAKIKFLSCEPLLSDLGELDLNGIDWVIAGGESGPDARPMHPDWVRNIQKQCQKQKVPFFFKQWGEWMNGSCNYKNKEMIILTNGDLIEPTQEEIKNYLKYYKISGYEYQSLNPTIISKVGKSKSGCLLDEKQYKEYPTWKN